MPLPVDRTISNTAAEHVDDHNTLHGQHNDLEGHAADPLAHGTYAPLVVPKLKIGRDALQAFDPSADISWDTETVDTDGFFPGTGTTITIPAGLDGVYSVTVRIFGLTPSAVGRAFFNFVAGGVTYRVAGLSGEDLAAASMVFDLVAGNTITVLYHQSTGVSVSGKAALQMYRVGT